MGASRERNCACGGACRGPDNHRRREAARTILALEAEHEYARNLLAVSADPAPFSERRQARRSSAWDIRFSPPYYLSGDDLRAGWNGALGSEEYPTNTRRTLSRWRARPGAAPGDAGGVSGVCGGNRHAARAVGSARAGDAQRNMPVVHASARDAEAHAAGSVRRPVIATACRPRRSGCWRPEGRGGARIYPWGDTFEVAAPTGPANRLNGCARLFRRGADLTGMTTSRATSGSGARRCSGPTPTGPTMGARTWPDEPRVRHGGSRRSCPLGALLRATGRAAD